MIHGGAGLVLQKQDYQESISSVLSSGRTRLAAGDSALSIVEHCVRLLEDDPLFNAGRGSVLNCHGTIEMDAAIMSGSDLSAGAVAGVSGVRNPISLARLVMQRSEHVMLIGEGAIEFARLEGAQFEDEEFFVTERRRAQWQRSHEAAITTLDHDDPTPGTKKRFGTVGAVACDLAGNVAAATSTGGITNKKFGRVGDSPIIGAGVYADNQTCAVSTTGHGEGFIRTVFARRVAEYMEYRRCSVAEAADAAIRYLSDRIGGVGGVIAVDGHGNWGSSFSAKAMIHGRADEQGVWVLT
jgi:beta-aspartyl-peptidase (threonine type)